MIFEALNTASEAGELLTSYAGLCHFHRRRDGTVTIREIIIHPFHRRQGHGRAFVEAAAGNASLVVARCPANLPSNAFWAALGFFLAEVKLLRSGRQINIWHWQRAVS